MTNKKEPAPADLPSPDHPEGAHVGGDADYFDPTKNPNIPTAAIPRPDVPLDVEERTAKRREHGTMTVQATADGYYGEKYRRAGDVFEIDATPRDERTRGPIAPPTAAPGTVPPNFPVPAGFALVPTRVDPVAERKRKAEDGKPAAFSSAWMRPADKGAAAHTTSSGEALRREQDAIRAGGKAARPTGAHAPLE